MQIRNAAIKLGFEAVALRVTFAQLDDMVILPCIIHWERKHFVVIPPQNYSRKEPSDMVTIADPLTGMLKLKKEDFLKFWIDPADNKGVVLIMEPKD